MTNPEQPKVLVWDSLEMTQQMIEERMQKTIEAEPEQGEVVERGWATNRFHQLVTQWNKPMGKHTKAREQRAKAKARKRRR